MDDSGSQGPVQCKKGKHVKDTLAKRSNVEITFIADGRLLSCVRRVLSYTWHRERHVELLVTYMYYQTFGTRTLLAHAQRRRKERRKKSKLKERRKKKIMREKKCDPTVQISVSMR